MMNKILLKGFTSSPEKYKECIDFWDKNIKPLIGDDFEEWLETKDSKGNYFTDGNPIYSLIKKDKSLALRIMQNESSSNKPYFVSWLEKIDDIQTLSIGIELSDSTLKTALDLIGNYLNKI